jgi:TPR repeat protein
MKALNVSTFFIVISIASLSTCLSQERETNSGNNLHMNARETTPCSAGSSFPGDTKAVTTGDRKAMYTLGCRYEHGDGTEKDLARAIAWYEKAARAGSIQGMNRLGEMYRDGDGVANDYGIAQSWFEKAAAVGSSDAMNNLGLMYLEARGVTRDYAQARYWLGKSADRENASAMINLGWLYQNGLGTAKDVPKAMELYVRAEAAGNVQATEMLGLLYQNGVGVPKDLDKALKYLEKAADQNDAGAMYALGQLYEGGSSGSTRDPAKAKYWYERLASIADRSQANQWESEWAMERLGDSYQSGIFTERNYQTSLDWFKKAAHVFNSPNAMDRIAGFYEYGYGVPKDEAEAQKWRARAAALRPPPAPVTPQCSEHDLETKLRVFEALGHQTVAVEKRNTTNAACKLGNYALGPNQLAHAWRRWRTTADDGTTVGCHDLIDNSFLNGITLVSPTLLPPVCSGLEVHDFAAGPFEPDWPPDNTTALPPPPNLVLTTSKGGYMQGEHVPLRLGIDGIDAAAPKTKQGCPVFLRAITYPTNLVRIDEMTPATPDPGGYFSMAINCNDTTLHGTQRHEFEFNGDQYLDQKVSNAVHFFTLAGRSPQGEIRLVESNSTTIAFQDPTEMPRQWGPTDHGVRVALSLDKLTYAIGEDIPLHIAAQVVASERPVYAEPDAMRGAFFADFSGAFHLTFIGEDGVIAGNEDGDNLRFRSLGGSSGPAVCPSPLEVGKVYPLERSAKLQRLLPNQPGKYRMFVTWSPYPASDPPCSQLGKGTGETRFRPFVTVESAPLVIQITGKSIAEPGVPDIPIYTGWKAQFRVVDTPLGEATALEDMRSHLQWLRLTLTKLQSKDSLQRQMAPGERLAGWRFATQSEVQTFFANFTGADDGRSSDPGIERALQHLLGGPLNSSRNPDTGWSRRDTEAVIAETRLARPEETPQSPAVAPGSPAPCSGCGVGFITWTAYIREDTIDGHMDASIDPGAKGWYVSDQGVFWGLNSATLVVREAP